MTEFKIFHFRPDYCFRPPDWRWQCSKDGITHVTDPWCERLLAYQRSPLESPIREAMSVAQAVFDHDPLRHAELEARILANQPAAEIARSIGLAEDVVQLYEATFFDVRSRLRHDLYIKLHVINPTRELQVPPFDVADLWRGCGYQHGVGILDVLMCGADRDRLLQEGISAYFGPESRLTDEVKDLIRSEFMPDSVLLLSKLLTAIMGDQSNRPLPD